LGGCIARDLLLQGASVSSFDIHPYTGPDQDRIASLVGNVTDCAQLTSAMAGVSIVFHTASIIDIRPIPSLKMHHVNVTGTAQVVAACKAAGVSTLVYTSSLEVVSGCDEHGRVQLLHGVDESMPMAIHHHLPYAATKAAAESLVLAAHSTELRTVAIRPGYIMGAGCIGLRVEMIRAATRANRYVTAKVPARISTVHAANCSLAHVAAAERVGMADVGGKSFFVRDFEANVVEMALETFSGLPIIPVLLPLRLAYIMGWLLDLWERAMHLIASTFGWTRATSDEVLDIRAINMAYIDIIVSDRRAREVLGYVPKVSQADCMREAKEWAKGFYASLLKTS